MVSVRHELTGVEGFGARGRQRRFSRGAVCAEDGSLRVTYDGTLGAFTGGGTLLWTVPLPDADAPRYAEPLAIAGGKTCIPLSESFAIFDAHGVVTDHVETPDFLHYGPSPNVSRLGELVFSSHEGAVGLYADGAFRTIGHFGLDVTTPSCFDDGTLAVAGYHGDGLCKVRLDGEVLWRSDLREADSIAVINNAGNVAAYSLNDGVSCIFSPDGTRLATLAEIAAFAACEDRDWIGRSRAAAMKFDSAGAVLWRSEMRELPKSNHLQPIVDREGFSYFGEPGALVCLDPFGKQVFDLSLGGEDPAKLALVAEGTIAAVTVGNLFLVS